ncbi:TPA: hypothetical protein EYP70_08315 [Candidatus Bathyarchaeota archaeon]|nr:hypothetical protein [Candidatus Bathyarchaeota archaeon]
MRFKRIINLIDNIAASSILILCHHNADPDAVCAAYALKSLLIRMRPNLTIEVASPGVSKLSKSLLPVFCLDVKVDESDFSGADLIIVVDTNTIKQLNSWGDLIVDLGAPLVFVDHHAIHSETERMAKIYISDEKASSTCEIVYGFFKELGLKLSKDEAKALFLGISFDTKHFILATSRTFKILSDLVNAGVNAQEVISLLSSPMDISERIARLKACQRMKIMRLSEWIVVFTSVSAFQASVARALIDLGAHLALVIGEKDGKLQISLRSNREFFEKTGIHLGRDVAKPLGERLYGMGGGHTTSAGVNGFGKIENAMNEAEKIIIYLLKNHMSI